MRRCRERRKRGGVLVEFEVVGTALAGLVALGWLPVRETRNPARCAPQ